jgi:hypothetical protein
MLPGIPAVHSVALAERKAVGRVAAVHAHFSALRTAAQVCGAHCAWAGWQGDGHTCQDIDECALHIDGCDQKCINTQGSYRCECNRGFTLVMRAGSTRLLVEAFARLALRGWHSWDRADTLWRMREKASLPVLTRGSQACSGHCWPNSSVCWHGEAAGESHVRGGVSVRANPKG